MLFLIGSSSIAQWYNRSHVSISWYEWVVIEVSTMGTICMSKQTSLSAFGSRALIPCCSAPKNMDFSASSGALIWLHYTCTLEFWYLLTIFTYFSQIIWKMHCPLHYFDTLSIDKKHNSQNVLHVVTKAHILFQLTLNREWGGGPEPKLKYFTTTRLYCTGIMWLPRTCMHLWFFEIIWGRHDI